MYLILIKMKNIRKTTIKQRKDGLWKATIQFSNKCVKKGTSELWDTKWEAKDWINDMRRCK